MRKMAIRKRNGKEGKGKGKGKGSVLGLDQGVLALVYEKARSVLGAMIAGGDAIVM